jgi:hypothetical protein
MSAHYFTSSHLVLRKCCLVLQRFLAAFEIRSDTWILKLLKKGRTRFQTKCSIVPKDEIMKSREVSTNT